MPVRVVNVRGINDPHEREKICYVGRTFAGWRGHRLCNPFRVSQTETAEEVIERYEKLILSLVHLEEFLGNLWEQTLKGKLSLGCWCINSIVGDGQPIICHAQVLAKMLMERFCISPEELVK